MAICSKIHKPYIIYRYIYKPDTIHIYETAHRQREVAELLSPARESLSLPSSRGGGGCACPPDRHTAAKLRTLTPTTAFLHWVRNKCFSTRKILTHLGRQLLRNESGEPKKAVQHLRRGSKMPGTWPGDSRGGAKGGERSSTCVPVQSEE